MTEVVSDKAKKVSYGAGENFKTGSSKCQRGWAKWGYVSGTQGSLSVCACVKTSPCITPGFCNIWRLFFICVMWALWKHVLPLTESRETLVHIWKKFVYLIPRSCRLLMYNWKWLLLRSQKIQKILQSIWRQGVLLQYSIVKPRPRFWVSLYCDFLMWYKAFERGHFYIFH